MQTLTFNEMRLKLINRFPSLVVLDNVEFSKSVECETGFWLKNSDDTTYTNKDKNTLYKANDYFNKNYELEVYKKFDKWCNRFGWYATTENYTLQLFKL